MWKEPCTWRWVGTASRFPTFNWPLSTTRKRRKSSTRSSAPRHKMSNTRCTQYVLGDYHAGIINLDTSVDMMQIIFVDGPLNRTEVFDAYCDLANGHLMGKDPTLALEYYSKVLHVVQQKQAPDRPCLQAAKLLGHVAYVPRRDGQYELGQKHDTRTPWLC
ncbi:hypothetical protein LSH36_1007g00027 [Paralvinella palmiformis]|uniref:Uncharacterized protein n=1 Tax=Paralvinella palmiformis TaxID=53620 RepID=A0AAD9IWP6_9ANNE|nr:hypothetical protein LSH36_1007g00027 [Paralvinella palmiformis]